MNIEAGSHENLKIVNLQKEFERFWLQAKSRPFTEQVKLWDKIIEKPHQDFYDSLVWAKKSRKDWKNFKLKKLRQYFNIYTKKYNQIVKDFNSFESVVKQQIRNYQKHFPEAKFDVPIYAVPSAGSFNGKANELSKKPGEIVLAFGIDMIVAIKDDVNVLYAHELFHIYHLEQLNFDEETFKTAKLTLPLWLEGFATFISARINPSASDSTILFDKKLSKYKNEIPWLSRKFLKVAHKKAWDKNDIRTYQTWFSGRGKFISRPELPPRTGYLLGLEVSRYLETKYSLNEMVRWSVDEAHGKVLEALNVIKIKKKLIMRNLYHPHSNQTTF